MPIKTPHEHGKSHVIVSGIDPSTGEPEPINTDAAGKLQVAFPSRVILTDDINVASPGDNVVVAAVTGQRIKVVSYVVVVSADMTITWAGLSGPMPLLAKGGIAIASSDYLFQTGVGESLRLNLSIGAAVGGHLSYFTEA